MAYDFTAASSQYLSTASMPASGTPMTIACWARPTISSVAVIAVGVNGGTHRNQITLTGGNNYAASQIGGSGSTNATGSTVRLNASSHVCAVFASSTSRRIYVNGTQEASDAATNIGTQNAANTITIGARWATTVGAYLSGWVAEVGVWDVVLNDSEIQSLADGFACSMVRPQNLRFYSPLVRDLIDVKGGLTITNNNTATVADHPRVYA